MIIIFTWFSFKGPEVTFMKVPRRELSGPLLRIATVTTSGLELGSNTNTSDSASMLFDIKNKTLSGVARARESNWRHASWGEGPGRASTHFIQPFKNAFKQI